MRPAINRRLAEFVHNLVYDDLPDEVVEKVKTLFLHGIGVGLAGYETETAQVAIDIAKKEGQGDVTIIIDGSRVTATAAAFANATILHSRAQGDYYHGGMLHPGVVIIPAALAIGEAAGSSGKGLIVALAAGYEVAARVSTDFCQLSVARGFRSTPLYGGLGAAAAAGKLLDSSEEQLVFSLGWAANLASGLLQLAMAKTLGFPLQDGLASRNGVFAAWLGQAGASAAEDMLEGERGLYYACCGSTDDVERVVLGLGQEYKMLDTYLKPYPVRISSQAQVSAVLALVQEHDISPEDIEGVEVRMPPTRVQYPSINSLKPSLMSAQYCVAVACVHRKVTLPLLADIQNRRVRGLMPKIRMVPDEGVNHPGCKLAITLRDGRVLKKGMAVTHEDYCYSFDEEQRLIESLISEMALPAERVKRMVELIANMESWKSVDELMQILSYSPRKVKRIRLPS